MTGGKTICPPPLHGGRKPGDTILDKAIQASFIIDTWDKVLFAYKYTHVFDQVELLLYIYVRITHYPLAPDTPPQLVKLAEFSLGFWK